MLLPLILLFIGSLCTDEEINTDRQYINDDICHMGGFAEKERRKTYITRLGFSKVDDEK